MNIFITGATGFVGSYLVDRLSKEGHNIMCLTRDISRISLPTNNNVQFIEGDINKPETYKVFLDGIDVIYHLAGYVRHEAYSKREAYNNNVEGSKNIFKIALEKKIEKVVYMSSAGIFHSEDESIFNEESKAPDKFINYYSYSKYLGYLEAKNFINKGLNIYIIMPVSIYGPGSPLFVDFFNFLVKKRIFFRGLLNKKISLVYIGDVIDALVKVSKASEFSREYLLTGKVLYIKEIINYIERTLKIKILILNLPIFLMTTSINFLDIVSKLLNKKFFINKEIFNFLIGSLLVSSEKIKSELNWSPSDFDKTFLEMLHWYKNNLNNR